MLNTIKFSAVTTIAGSTVFSPVTGNPIFPHFSRAVSRSCTVVILGTYNDVIQELFCTSFVLGHQLTLMIFGTDLRQTVRPYLHRADPPIPFLAATNYWDVLEHFKSNFAVSVLPPHPYNSGHTVYGEVCQGTQVFIDAVVHICSQVSVSIPLAHSY